MDTFRKKYTPITDEQKNLVAAIKAKAEELADLYGQAFRNQPEEMPPISMLEECHLRSENNRCLRHGMDRLEESVMWAVKAATTETATVPV